MLRNNIDNKFSSPKRQSDDKTTITFIRDQLFHRIKKLRVLRVGANTVAAGVIIFRQIVSTL